MTTSPKAVEIREFQVGFGDCFLLTFVYSAADRRHVLIDFGTTELPASVVPRPKTKPRGKQPGREAVHMRRVADEIKKVCSGGELVAVVATHRHADHISGFGTENRTGQSGTVIRDLKPRLVLQPWTEDPSAARNAKTATKLSNRSPKSMVAGLNAMHDIARMVVELTEQKPAWMSAALTKELRFLGMDNIKNASAVKNLIAMGSRKGARAVWANHGSKSGLEKLLPGVKVQVLGPPTVVQSEKIRKQRSRDKDQFWHLLGATTTVTTGNPLRDGLRSERTKTAVPADARWFRDRLERLRGEQLLEIVRTLDDQMNNTSLILLLEVCGKKLLFPGDAQIENWSYALEDAADAAKTRKLLADVDVYKVGHHGSLNATPKELLWKGFKKKGKKKELNALLSTMPGKHGKARNHTEVPRKPLLEALEGETTLYNTDELSPETRGGQAPLCHAIEIDRKGVRPLNVDRSPT